MLNIRIHKALAPLAAAAALVWGAPAHANFTSLTVFGDSLSDAGNNALLGLFDPAQVVTGNSYVPSFAYGPVGTYSNGPVWATTFAGLLGLPLSAPPSFAGGLNYAAGGAKTGIDGGPLPSPPFPPDIFYPFSLRTQSTIYLTATGGFADPTGLYVVAGGGNNARAALEDPNLFLDFGGVVTSYAQAFATDIGNIVDNLQAGGAQNIVVWNVPNLSLAPAVVAQGPLAVVAADLIADFMNAFLGAELAGEAGVEIFDINGLLSNPAVFGSFANSTDACGAAAPGTDCNSYVFWDGIHPTTAAHNVIALQMAAAVPEPETYALMALGLVAVGFAARRRKQQSVR